MDLEKTITLRTPVKLGDVSYDTLNLREPTAIELDRAATGATTSFGVSITLIHLVAKIPRKVAEELRQRDLREATDFLNSFDAIDLPIGVMSSQN